MSDTDISRLFGQTADRTSGDAAFNADLDRYRPYVAHLGLPRACEDDMMLAVWRIMQNSVNRAFGDDPVQSIGAPEDKSTCRDKPDESSVIELQ